MYYWGSVYRVKTLPHSGADCSYLSTIQRIIGIGWQVTYTPSLICFIFNFIEN